MARGSYDPSQRSVRSNASPDALCAPDRLPDLLRRRRHFHQRAGAPAIASSTALMTVAIAPVVAASPTPLTPSGLVVAGTMCSCVADHRHVDRARHGVVHERAGEQLAAVGVVDDVLAHRLAEAHAPARRGTVPRRSCGRGCCRSRRPRCSSRSPSGRCRGSISTSATWQPLGNVCGVSVVALVSRSSAISPRAFISLARVARSNSEMRRSVPTTSKRPSL